MIGRTLAWLLALAIATAITGCAKTELEYFESAKRMYASGDRGGAMIEAKNALAQNPKNAQARLLVGTLHNDAGNPKEAEAELRRAIEYGLIEGGRVFAELARALIAGHEPRKLLAEINPLDSFEPDPLAVIHGLRGQAYLSVRDGENARKSLAAAAQISPEHAQTALLRARIQVQDRKAEEALATVDNLLKAQPKNVDALMLRADLLHLLKRSPEAAPVYDTILALRGSVVQVHVARALLMLSLGKLDDAQKDVDAIRKLSRHIPIGHYLRAMLLLKRGKLADADSAVQDALRVQPNYPAAQLLAGIIAHSRGSYATAEQFLYGYVQRQPRNLVARKYLAATQIELRKNREAFETLEPALGESTRDTAVLALAGDALMRGGDLDRAGQYYERAMAGKPEDARLRTSYAVLQLQQGETDRALAELEAASKLDGSEYRSDFVLIGTLFRKGEFDKALEAVRRLEAKQPKSALSHNLAGSIHVARKDLAAARKSFERALELDPKQVVAATSLAELDIKENRIDDAQRRFEKMLTKDPKNLEMMLALSSIADQKKDQGGVLKWLEAARAAHPSAVDPLGRLSSYYLARGQSAKALEYAHEAASRNPNVPAALDILGTAQVGSREFNAAAQTYARLAQITPKQPIVHYRLAAAQQAGGDLKGAHASLRKAIELDPKLLTAWIALTAVQISQGAHDQALKSAATVRELAPEAPQGFVLQGEALLRSKRPAEALKAFERALALDPSAGNVAKVYVARRRAGNPAMALADLEKWVARNPKEPSTRMLLADAYLSDSRYKEAISEYEAVVAGAPKNPLALNNLAMSYLAVKDPRAVEAARRAHEIAGNVPSIVDTYGWVLVENGKLKEGLVLLEKAKGLSPQSDEISYHLAVALARSGDKLRARKELDALLALKSSPYAQQARALLNTL